MGEVRDADLVLRELRVDNPRKRDVDLKVYADALVVYCEASRNIARNGAVVLHPRTMVPIENPYLKLVASKGRILGRMRNIKGDRVLGLLLDGTLRSASHEHEGEDTGDSGTA